MSINGVLEDLALADVLQFVHLSRRTGTLYLWREDERRAEIGFHDGRIVSAWSPGHRRLGDLLLAAGVVDEATLESALQRQKREEGERILGQILLAEGAVTREDIHRVIKEQVQATIFDLLTWRYGSFHFEVGELNPIDDVGLVPGELLDDLRPPLVLAPQVEGAGAPRQVHELQHVGQRQVFEHAVDAHPLIRLTPPGASSSSTP